GPVTRRLELAAAVLAMLLPGRVLARKAEQLTFTTPPLTVPARSDLEQWTVLRIPARAPLDIAGMSRDYEGPAGGPLDPARYVVPGQRFHYACWHDNGVSAPPELTCEEIPGITPGQAIGDSVLTSDTSGPGTPCHHEGADEAECPSNPGPYTGNCVRAN